MFRQITAMLLLAACLIPAGAHAACSVDARATVPLGIADNVLTVPVEVNGITATFVLDTGAQRSLVSIEAVQRLGWRGTHGSAPP